MPATVMDNIVPDASLEVLGVHNYCVMFYEFLCVSVGSRSVDKIFDL